MSEEEKSRNWWNTLPGIITGLAAVVTALTGLVVAIKQTGWFETQTTPAIRIQSGSLPAAPSAGAPSAVTRESPPVASSPSPTMSVRTVGLPALRDYTLGGTTYTLLQAELSPQTTEKDALQIRIRMMNNGRYDTNFWDRSFRLIVNGVPMAPESNLNELVPAQSAKEGNVIFVVPRGTTNGKLKISFGDSSTEIPLDLASPR